MSQPPEPDKIRKLFLNHFLYQIRADDYIKMNVENTMIESVMKHLHGEFHNIDQSDTELRTKLRELNKNR